MQADTVYAFHTDPGHGWLEVPLADVSAFGIEDRISTCSYFRAGRVYLEEDCDASLFCEKFRERFGAYPQHDERFLQHTPIRGFERFRKVLGAFGR